MLENYSSKFRRYYFSNTTSFGNSNQLQTFQDVRAPARRDRIGFPGQAFPLGGTKVPGPAPEQGI